MILNPKVYFFVIWFYCLIFPLTKTTACVQIQHVLNAIIPLVPLKNNFLKNIRIFQQKTLGRKSFQAAIWSIICVFADVNMCHESLMKVSTFSVCLAILRIIYLLSENIAPCDRRWCLITLWEDVWNCILWRMLFQRDARFTCTMLSRGTTQSPLKSYICQGSH